MQNPAPLVENLCNPVYNGYMKSMRQKRSHGPGTRRTSINVAIKNKISTALRQRRIAVKEIILFGSRARGDFDIHSDYDILIIIKEQVDPRKKIEIIELIRTELAALMISSDIVLKSIKEAEYYKNKIGSVVREAFKEGVPL